MEISYKNNFWDFVQFHLYQISRSKISLAALALVLFSVGRLALDVAQRVRFSLFGKIIAFNIVVVGGFTLFLVFVLILILMSAFATYLVHRGKSGECKVQASDNGLIVETSIARSEIKWTGIEAIKQNKSLILIYVTKRMAYLVPRRVFANKADANKFFTDVTQHWQSRNTEKPLT